MARNGSGTASLLAPLAVANTVSSSTTVNATMDDVAEMLTNSINKDGTKAWAANQSLGGFKLTSMGDGSARGDNSNLGQVQDGKANWVAAGGTADVITATYSPAITVLVDGQECFIRASGANTVTTPTFSPNTLTARTIVKNGGVALAVGDIAGAGHELHLRYLLASTRWELLNPAIPAGLAAASTTDFLTGTNAAKYVTPDAAAALWEAGADIADGAAITIGEGGYFNLITSTTAITSFVVTTDKAGRTFRVRFNTARTLTYNATSLIIPGAANVTTAQGDIAQVRSLGSGNVVVDWYTKASGQPLVPSSSATGSIDIFGPTTIGTGAATFKISSSIIAQAYKKIELHVNGISSSSSTGATDGNFRISGDNGTGYGASLEFATDNVNDANTANAIIEITNAQATTGSRGIRYTQAGGSTQLFTSQSITTGYINAIELSVTNGNIDAGTYTLIGYR